MKIILNRRWVIGGASISAMVGGHAANSARASEQSLQRENEGAPKGNKLLSWEQFLSETGARAADLVKDRSQSGQDAYLYMLAQHAVKLGELPDLNPADFGGLNPAYLLDLIHRGGTPFIVLYWKMEPGAVLPAHCHPGANVCTLCLGGEAIIRNFNTDDTAPNCWDDSELEFGVTESKTQILRAGAINTVSENDNNIHRFEAGPGGAEGIDITTVYDSPAKPFSFLKLTSSSLGSFGQKHWRGRWVGKDIKSAL